MPTFNSKHRAPAILFLVIFSLLLLWPLLTWISPTSWKIDSFENRHLAAFPTKIAVDWPRRFESYLDDNLPNRGVLLRINAWVKYHVFNTSPVGSVLVGKDGWLFHRMPDDMLEFEGRLQRKIYQMRRLRIVLEERRDWLAERGIDYMVLIAPTKQSVYPEKMPSWLTQSGKDRSRREMLKSELHRVGSSLDLFDFTPVLLESKKQWGDSLFYKHDSHWNYQGALQAYSALAKHYPEWFREPSNDWESMPNLRESNLMRLMGLSGQETTLHPQPAGGFIAKRLTLDTALLKNMALRGSTLLYQRDDVQTKRLYIMADSFAGWDSTYLAENFSRTVITNTWGDQWKRHEQFPTRNIEIEHPNLVIEQMVENRLDLGMARNLLGDSAGNNHPDEIRYARLRRLLRDAGEAEVKFQRSDDDLIIHIPLDKTAQAYIIRLNLEVSESSLIEGLSPYPSTSAWMDLCKRGGELTRSTIKAGRSELLLCAVSDPNAAQIRLKLSQATLIEVLGIALSPHPDIF